MGRNGAVLVPGQWGPGRTAWSDDSWRLPGYRGRQGSKGGGLIRARRSGQRHGLGALDLGVIEVHQLEWGAGRRESGQANGEAGPGQHRPRRHRRAERPAADREVVEGLVAVAAVGRREQQVRAICGFPLGSPELIQPAAMVNLLGDLWTGGEPNWAGALAMPDVKLHLYGKTIARPGRKMGHITVLSPTASGARERALAARSLLGMRVER